MEQAGNLGFGALLDEMLRLTRQHFPAAALVVLGLTAADLILVWMMSDFGSFLPTSVLQFFMFYHFSEHLLADRLPAGQARQRHYGALFFASFMSGIGILVGLVLLVIPGIYLMARWALITPLVIAEQRDGSDALSESWDVTLHSNGVLIAMMLTTGAVLVGVPLLLLIAAEGAEEMAAYASEVLFSLGVSAWSAISSVMAVAAYRLLKPGTNAIREVFA